MAATRHLKIGTLQAFSIVCHLPPRVPNKKTGNAFSVVCAQQATLLVSQKKDAMWLNSLSQGQDAMEWNGFNNG